MAERNIHSNQTLRVCFCGIMTAIIFVANYLRIPFMGTSVHMTNALCAIGGLLFGPGLGFVAAGLGSALYDLTAGYGAECLITFVTKGAIAVVAGLIALGIAHKPETGRGDVIRVVIACVAGALTYVALYMLKTFIFGMWVNGLGLEGTLVKMGTKIVGSLINALFASVAGPIVFLALKPALRHAGLMEKM